MVRCFKINNSSGSEFEKASFTTQHLMKAGEIPVVSYT